MRHLQATCYDSDGNVVTGPIFWTSSDESVATVDPDGNVTAQSVSESPVIITAHSWDGHTGSIEMNTYLPENAAKLISHNTPASMCAGAIYTVSSVFENSGTSTWKYQDPNYTCFGTPDADDPNIPNPPLWTWAALPSATVDPGQQAIFTFQVTAPSTPGIYRAKWQMAKYLIGWFGMQIDQEVTVHEPTPVASIVVDPPSPRLGLYGANMAWWSYEGAKQLNVTCYDTNGNLTFSPITWISANENIAVVDSNGLVTARALGSTTITARANNGITGSCSVEVYTPANAAQIIGSTFPSTVDAGSTFQASVTVKNVGTSTWTEDDWQKPYSLGARGDFDPFRPDNIQWSFAPNRIILSPTDRIEPGQTHTFIIDMVAPSTPGDYFTDWQMVQDAVCWFGEVAVKTITVQ